MATVAAKPMTAEEFFEWVQRPENRDRKFELEEGEIVEMSRPGERHGAVCGNVTGILWTYTVAKKKGYVCSNDTGLILDRDPDTLRGPDVCLYTEAGRYDHLKVEFTDKLPNLIVEVLSPSDRIGKIMKRVALFQARGVPMVWLVDPEGRNVTVCRPGQSTLVLEETDELTGMDVLPDFRCRVADLFFLPGEA